MPMIMPARHLALVAALLAPLALAACEEEGPAESAGEEAGQALEEAGEAVDDAAN